MEEWIMRAKQNTRLTASELSVCWSSYQNNSLSISLMRYFLAQTVDRDIKAVLGFSLQIAERGFQESKALLIKDQQPVPVGFTNDDVNLSAPRLFSDAFCLYYLKNMSKVGLSVYGVALATTSNREVRNSISQSIEDSTQLYNKTADVLESKGLFVPPPYVTTTDDVDFIDSKSYLNGLFHQEQRPLNVIEITHIHANLQSNVLGAALLTGFAQVTKSKNVHDYCSRGKAIAKKHAEIFSKMLTRDDLPAPVPWDLEITDSTVAPFSDKLMMYHISLIIASSISNYATAAAASLRTNIASSYVRLAAEDAKYAKSGFDLMVQNEWLEQPPQAPDHKHLAKV